MGALVVVLAFAVTPAGAQTDSSSSSDYTPQCVPGSSALGAAPAPAGHLSAHVATQVDPNCPPSGVLPEAAVQGTQVEATALSRTGSNSTIPLTRLGLGLLAVGGLVVLVTRRMRRTAPTQA
jgi:hypothetical protein